MKKALEMTPLKVIEKFDYQLPNFKYMFTIVVQYNSMKHKKNNLFATELIHIDFSEIFQQMHKNEISGIGRYRRYSTFRFYK